MLNPLSLFRSLFWRNGPSLASPNPSADEAQDVIAIVGGGIIGLSTAYNLACKNSNGPNSAKVKIVVLEAGSSGFSAASGRNTGCLHYFFPESFGEDITTLGKYSFDLWKTIAADYPQFVIDAGYRSQSLLPVVSGSGIDEKALPNWIVKEGLWDISWGSRGDPCASVNPLGVAIWLERECQRLGVEIRTETTVSAACLSKGNVLEGLKCSSSKSSEPYLFPCHRVVLAAGPWTPTLVKSLFPASTIDLQPATNAGDWVVIKNTNSLDPESLAVVFFDKVVHEKLEFSGRNDGSIWVCGQRNYTAELPLPNKEDQPDDQVISNLMDYTRRFVYTNGHSMDEEIPNPTVLAKGRSFRPSTVSGLPFISKVPPQLLVASEEDHTSCPEVFVCYGHGSYGITLGMGSGKLIAQLVNNEKTDIDLSKFMIS